jgi:trans-2,3-dihydro-3-hydroxyanthranilate isomerase
VLNGHGLTTEQMQSIAAKFNLAETTFVLPPKGPHTAEVWIFTPRAELPFAGHPNIGTAFVLATLGNSYGSIISDPLIFEERLVWVKLDLIRNGTSIIGARLAAPQPLMRSEDIGLDIVATACSIGVDDIETANHPPCIVSSGVPFVIAELKSRSSLTAARPQSEISSKHLGADRATGILLYTHDKGDDVAIQARMFAPLYGIPEDPATGSANVALVGLLASLRRERDVTLQLRIAQGVDMGRPSLLEATAEKRCGGILRLCVPLLAKAAQKIAIIA